MTATKTELQVFIETAAGFWRAIGELDDVARRSGGDDLQREAYSACMALQKTLDVHIRDWNGMGTAEYPVLRITQCVSHARCVMSSSCEIYVAGPGYEGYCETCWVAKKANAAREAARR